MEIVKYIFSTPAFEWGGGTKIQNVLRFSTVIVLQSSVPDWVILVHENLFSWLEVLRDLVILHNRVEVYIKEKYWLIRLEPDGKKFGLELFIWSCKIFLRKVSGRFKPKINQVKSSITEMFCLATQPWKCDKMINAFAKILQALRKSENCLFGSLHCRNYVDLYENVRN